MARISLVKKIIAHVYCAKKKLLHIRLKETKAEKVH